MSAVMKASGPYPERKLRAFQMKEAGAANSDPEREARELTAQLERIQNGIKEFAEQARKAHGDLSAETKEAIDKLLSEQTAVGARLTELEQKMVRAPGAGGDDDNQAKTVGEIVVGNDDVQALMKAQDRRRVTVRVKAITSAGGSAGVLVRPDRQPGFLTIPDRRLTVRDLITPGRTVSNAIEYVRETGFTNAAAPVAEGAAKPESGLTFDLVITGVVTVAHWVQASRQILSDAPMLQSYIDGRLRYGLAYREEAQLLKGSGVAGNINGIWTQATPYVAPIVIAGATPIDILRLAMLQAELAEFPATGMVLNPINWAAIELTKDGQSRYLFANPQQLQGPTLWGLPVVPTKALDAGEFLVGAFKLGAQVFDREDASVLVSTEDRDNFIKNMVTILGEERLALAVYRPEAFIRGTFA